MNQRVDIDFLIELYISEYRCFLMVWELQSKTMQHNTALLQQRKNHLKKVWLKGLLTKFVGVTLYVPPKTF